MSGTYVASPPAPSLADDVELGAVERSDEDTDTPRDARTTTPPGAVLARTMWVDRDGVMQYARDMLGRATHCLMVAGDLSLYVSLRADGEMQILFQRKEEEEDGHELIVSGVYKPEDDRFHLRRRRRRSAIDSVE